MISSFSCSRARGWLTDLEMVGREGVEALEMWGSVMVHKAVMAPLWPVPLPSQAVAAG